MQFEKLQQHTRCEWQRRSRIHGALIQPELFEQEIRQYGPVEAKQTWVDAVCRFYALNVWDCCLDSYALITLHFNFQESDWQYELRHQILDEFLSLPNAVDALIIGFQQLMGDEFDFTTEEKECANGIFELVGGSAGFGREQPEFCFIEREQIKFKLGAIRAS